MKTGLMTYQLLNLQKLVLLLEKGTIKLYHATVQVLSRNSLNFDKQQYVYCKYITLFIQIM